MTLPLAVAIFGLVAGLMTASLLSGGGSIPSLGPTLATLIALGVGVDYALFIVTRHRANLKAGMLPAEAAARALNTAGRAVLFAGITVCLALTGLLVLRLNYLSGLGIAAAIAVLFTMAAAVTLLPALLGFCGTRVLSRKERRRLAEHGPELEGTAGWWPRWAATLQRPPPRPAAPPPCRRAPSRAPERATPPRVDGAGPPAVFGDFAPVISHKLPLSLAVIIAFGFLLLPLAFRSPLIPAVAAVMNLLAAGASFGVMVAVFQYGWGLRLLNLGQAGPVEAFLPVLMLAVLFGLSTDYEVFLVSRMHEEWAATGNNHHAVRTGQATTGRVIAAAAAIMICVFSAFILSGQQAVGEFGLGLGVAVLLDAFLLRTILVPALMHLLGRANWWLPTRIDNALPHLSIEHATEPAGTPDTAQAVPAARNHDLTR